MVNGQMLDVIIMNGTHDMKKKLLAVALSEPSLCTAKNYPSTLVQ
jgi:hypothetical protein